MRIIAKILPMTAIMGAAFGATPSFAAHYLNYVTDWKLENYIANHDVVIWYSNAPDCPSGKLVLTGANEDDKNRFWSTILTAKTTNRQVGVYYNVFADRCELNSFYIRS